MPGSSSKSNLKATKSAPASSNWLALQKKLPRTSGKEYRDGGPPSRKRRKIQHDSTSVPFTSASSGEPSAFIRGTHSREAETKCLDADADLDLDSGEMKNGESISQLRKMVFGKLEYTPTQDVPGKYLALDCEMVGVGIEGLESSLARVSLVNYHGAVQLDEFVRQRERVVDYRTQWSGIREGDMVKAKPFEEVQKQVADMLKDRILVGHAVFNDLKALLLSHPRPLTRDTQYHAGKHKLLPTKYPALRNLVKQELGLTIQGGEHSSVTDARATMAVYRLHRKEWEKGLRPVAEYAAKTQSKSHKRKATEDDDGDGGEDGDAEDENRGGEREKRRDIYPGGGRKGVSSGLSTVVTGGKGRGRGGEAEKQKWWTQIGGGSGGAKGSMRL